MFVSKTAFVKLPHFVYTTFAKLKKKKAIRLNQRPESHLSEAWGPQPSSSESQEEVVDLMQNNLIHL